MVPESSRYATMRRRQAPPAEAVTAAAPEPRRKRGSLELRGPGGRLLVYHARRFLPQGSLLPVAQEINVVEGERLDLIAFRTLGDPEQYWRICDANDAMNPRELLSRVGRRLRIPLPVPPASPAPEVGE